MGSDDWQTVRDAGHCSNPDPGWTTERLIDNPDKPGEQIPDPDEQSPIRIPQIFTYPPDPNDSSKGCDPVLWDATQDYAEGRACDERDPPGKWGPKSVGWDISGDPETQRDEAGLPSGRPSKCDPLPGAETWVSKSNEDYDKCMDKELQESYSGQRPPTTDLLKRKAKCLWSRSEKHVQTLEPNEKNMTKQDTDADWRYSRDPDFEGDVPGLLRLQHPEVRTARIAGTVHAHAGGFWLTRSRPSCAADILAQGVNAKLPAVPTLLVVCSGGYSNHRSRLGAWYL
jgi:hypothetical protein